MHMDMDVATSFDSTDFKHVWKEGETSHQNPHVS